MGFGTSSWGWRRLDGSATDGYAEACADGGFECIQEKWADSCLEYAQNHKEEVAAMLAEAAALAASVDGSGSSTDERTSPTGDLCDATPPPDAAMEGDAVDVQAADKIGVEPEAADDM